MESVLSWSLEALSGVYSLVTLPLYCAASALLSVTRRIAGAKSAAAVTMVRRPGGGGDDSVWVSSDVAVDSGDIRLLATPEPSVQSLADLLDRAASRYPQRPCLGTRVLLAEEEHIQPDGRIFKKQSLGNYRWDSFADVKRRAEQLSRGIRSLGVRPGDKVALYAETRAEWQLCAQALFRCRAPAVTLYASLGEDALVYGVDQSGARLLITSRCLLEKVAALLHRMPRLACVVYMDGGIGDESQPPPKQPSGTASSVRLMALSALIANNKPPSADSGVDSGVADTPAAAAAEPADLAVIMYTSGSTGLPKGVMISHAHMLAMVAGVADRIPEMGERPDDAYIGYLPLAHVLELAAELACLSCGVPVGYGSPLTLTDASAKVKPGTLGDAAALRPTLMAAVPAVLDRVAKAVRERARSRGPLGRALLAWALGYKQRWSRRGWATPLLDWLVFAKIRSLLGGRLRLLLSGGAPLSAETHAFALATMGASVVQGYGLTETCGAGCIQSVVADGCGGGGFNAAMPALGSVGPPLACCQVRLRDWPEGGYTAADEPWPRGEILIGGPCVTAGYYRMPELTAQDFCTDAAGVRWFCTGDIGQAKEGSGLEIVDRKKDLVKLQGGEYVSLGKVELALSSSPYVEQLCAYGDSLRDFVVLLVVPKRPQLARLAAELGIAAPAAAATAGDCVIEDALLGNRKLREAVLRELLSAGSGRLERFEAPARLHLCREAAWLPESGLVTDSYKLRRRQLLERYRPEIDAMYAE